MRGLYLFIGIICFFLSCTDRYRIQDDSGQHCVTFLMETPIAPDSGYPVRLYFDNEHTGSSDPHVLLRWSKIGGVSINWKTKPIKDRSYLVRSSTLDTVLYDVKSFYTEEEDAEIKDTSKWQFFDLVEIANGKYANCR